MIGFVAVPPLEGPSRRSAPGSLRHGGRVRGAALLLGSALLLATSARGDDEHIPGRRALLADSGFAAVRMRPATGTSIGMPGPAEDPRVAGATLRLFDTTLPGAGGATFALPKQGWRGLGNPAGSSGYKFSGHPSFGDTCQSIILRSDQIRIVCKGPKAELRLPFLGGLGVVLELGSGGTRYCADFGGQVDRNDHRRLKRSNAPAPAACPAITATRPNFIVVNLDDTRADGVDRMPVLAARVEGEGLTFTNSYVPFSSCCSSRASLLTGNYARTHGVLGVAGLLGGADRFRETGSENETIAVWLRAAGYQTGLFGKYLNSYSQATEGYCNVDFHVPPGWTRWRAMLSPEQYGGINGSPATFVDEAHRCTVYQRGGCSGSGAPCCVDAQCGGTATCTNPTPESRLHNSCANYTTDLSAEQMRDFVADSLAAGESFFAYWTPYASHGASPGIMPIPAAPYLHAFESLSPFRPPNYDVVTAAQPRWLQAASPDPFGGNFTDAMRKRAYETLLSVDEQLEITLAHLASLGVDRDTVILVTSDNGSGWGEHRMFTQRKGCPYEECLRVPLLVRYPRGIGDAPATRSAPVLNIDVAPTLAALAGVGVPVATDGVDASAWIVGPPPASWREEVLAEFVRPGATGARDDRLRYTGNPSDGDRIRVLHGDPLLNQPRQSTLFEFDAGDGTPPGSVPVSIGASAADTFTNLATAATSNVPFTAYSHFTDTLLLFDTSPEHHGVLFWREVDQGGVMTIEDNLPDFNAVRDIAGGFNWVEYETGERELYDLHVDPWETTNLADDPGYSAVRLALEARLDQLLAE